MRCALHWWAASHISGAGRARQVGMRVEHPKLVTAAGSAAQNDPPLWTRLFRIHGMGLSDSVRRDTV